MDKKTKSILNFGRVASLIIGCGYLVIGVLMIFDPAERYRGDEYLNQFYLHPFIPLTWRSIFVLVAFLTIMWITATDKMVRNKSDECEGIYSWIKILGYASAVISAIQWYKELYQWHYLENYMERPEYYRTLIPIIGTGIDPDYIWMFGALGIWYLFTSVLAGKHKVFGRAMMIFGVLSGVALLLTMFFAITDILIYFPNGNQMAVMQFTSLMGGVCGAIYHLIGFKEVGKVLKSKV